MFGFPERATCSVARCGEQNVHCSAVAPRRASPKNGKAAVQQGRGVKLLFPFVAAKGPFTH